MLSSLNNFAFWQLNYKMKWRNWLFKKVLELQYWQIKLVYSWNIWFRKHFFSSLSPNYYFFLNSYWLQLHLGNFWKSMQYAHARNRITFGHNKSLSKGKGSCWDFHCHLKAWKLPLTVSLIFPNSLQHPETLLSILLSLSSWELPDSMKILLQ